MKTKSKKIIHEKYFEAFNFYFAKPINEILANINTSHVILFKDYLYYDDLNEYLKRYYTKVESLPRINNLYEFYIKAGSNPKPNLSIHEQNKFIQKRNMKIHKLFLMKLQNYNDMPKTHRAKDDGGNNNNNNKDNDEVNNVPCKILTSNIYNEDTIKTNVKYNDNEKGNSDIRTNYEGSFKLMLSRYEKNMMKISYESKEHDIYNPSYSSDASSFDCGPITPLKNSITCNQNSKFEQNIMMENSIFIPNDYQLSCQNDKLYHNAFNTLIHSSSPPLLPDASDIILINEIMNIEELPNYNKGISMTTTTTSAITTQVNSNKKQNPSKSVKKDKESYPLDNYHPYLISENGKNLIKTQEASKERCPSANIEMYNNNNNTEYIEYSTNKAYSPRIMNNAIYNSHNEKMNMNIQSQSQKKMINVQKPDVETLGESLSSSCNLQTNHNINAVIAKTTTIAPIAGIGVGAGEIGAGGIGRVITGGTGAGGGVVTGASTRGLKSTPNSKKGNNNNGLSKPSTANSDKPKVNDNLNTIKHIKELVQKHSKYSDEGLIKKSKMLIDELKKNLPFPNKFVDVEKSNKTKESYIQSDYINDKPKKSEKIGQLHRSKTEDGLFQKMGFNKSKKPSASPLKVIEESVPNPNSGTTLTPSNARKTRQYYRVVSNEGLPYNFTSVTLGFNPATNNSHESSKSIDTALPIEKKGQKIEGFNAQDKPGIRPPSSLNSNRDANIAQSQFQMAYNINQNQYQQQQQQQTLPNKNIPISPNLKFDLKLNLAKLNQPNTQRTQTNHDTNDNNSYGFWTSRSSKERAEEQSKSKKSLDTDKDYFLKSKYTLAENEAKDKKKSAHKASKSLTKSHTNFDIKPKEGGGGIITYQINKNVVGPSKTLDIGNQYFIEKKTIQGVSIENGPTSIVNVNKMSKKQIKK